MRVVLASASPARLAVLRSAGIEPDVLVSDVDEEALTAQLGPRSPSDLCLALARAKATAVAERLAGTDDDPVVVGCDSVLDVDGVAFGKPASAEQARERWATMAGRSGLLHTGHWVIRPMHAAEVGAVQTTRVFHGTPTPVELEAYLASGEPLGVAGGFTIDGLGGAFVERIEGDPSNVVGVSLPLLRRLLGDLDIVWTDLWAR